LSTRNSQELEFFTETANKAQKSLLDQLRIFCRTALRGFLAFYDGQILAEGVSEAGTRDFMAN